MRNGIQKHQVIDFPTISAAFSFDKASKRLSLDSFNRCYSCLPASASNQCPRTRQKRADSVIGRMNKIGESVDTLAQGLREHVRLGPKLTETVKGKLRLGAKILQVGGVEKVFKEKFKVEEDEKLVKACQCYLSTTAGPLAGLLFISTDKLAFCSDKSIKILSPTGKVLRIRYKVSIPLEKIRRASGSNNLAKPSQKYIQIITYDNFEFWFMGFLNYQKTLRYLQKMISEVQ